LQKKCFARATAARNADGEWFGHAKEIQAQNYTIYEFIKVSGIDVLMVILFVV